MSYFLEDLLGITEESILDDNIDSILNEKIYLDTIREDLTIFNEFSFSDIKFAIKRLWDIF